MLSSLRLSSFKSHADFSADFHERNMVSGPNGAGKTNVLEAIYLLLNAMPLPGSTVSTLVSTGSKTLSVSGNVLRDAFDLDFRIGCDLTEKKAHFLFQGSTVSKARFLHAMPVRAIFFSPLEMNILYLGPALRRDFLDEILLLSYPAFIKIRRDYSTVLRNRNAVLKNIREGIASRSDLDAWDRLFSDATRQYMLHRMRFIRYVTEHMDTLESLLEHKYRLSFAYDTKLDLENIESSLESYLADKRERDILAGHTYIGPHLDDFSIMVEIGEHSYSSEQYLSRGENKTLLLGLKFLQILFLEEHFNKKTVLLFDDLFSELDRHHIEMILSQYAPRQMIISSQNRPDFIDSYQDFHIIEIH